MPDAHVLQSQMSPQEKSGKSIRAANKFTQTTVLHECQNTVPDCPISEVKPLTTYQNSHMKEYKEQCLFRINYPIPMNVHRVSSILQMCLISSNKCGEQRGQGISIHPKVKYLCLHCEVSGKDAICHKVIDQVTC